MIKLNKKILEDIQVSSVECYLDGYAREAYAIDAYYGGLAITITGIILREETELTDNLFDKMEVKTAIYQQLIDGDLEIIINKYNK